LTNSALKGLASTLEPDLVSKFAVSFTLCRYKAEDATRILGANVGKVNSISSSEATPDEDESYSFVNEPFKYTAGEETPTGRERWLNRFVIDEDDDTVYFLSVAESESTPDGIAAASLKVPDPALLAEALSAEDFAPLSDTGASAGFVMTKV
jgi:hypothetical protein